jgi:hypothetical protein
MKYALLLALLLVPFGSVAQDNVVEHAPTAAQCQADQALWRNKLSGDISTSAPPFMTIRNWPIEMNNCVIVDPSHSDAYLFVSALASATMARREFDFLKRHDLFSQFVTEDNQGIR